jgi:hypothetical protein
VTFIKIRSQRRKFLNSDSVEPKKYISNLLYEFYKTPFCRTRFLEHDGRSDECYKANKCVKMAYKTSVIQYFFYFALILNFKLKKKVKTEQVSVPETGIEKKSFSKPI